MGRNQKVESSIRVYIFVYPISQCFWGHSPTKMTYSDDPIKETISIFRSLLKDESLDLPDECKKLVDQTEFVNSGQRLKIPCPLKECEVSAALKGVESLAALSLVKLRFGIEDKAKIDLFHSNLFLILTYLASIDGQTKLDEKVKLKLKPTDLYQAQSITYRRMAANLYRTKDNRFYHIHGSLEASKTLNMIGLPAYNPKVVNYHQVVDCIQTAVSKYTCGELEALNVQNRQAGIEALKYEQFLDTDHGKVISSKPLWEIDCIENETLPVAFSESISTKGKKALEGVKVLELCRIIAGPTIGRILAEYGATVVKVTSPDLPDVPFFQVEGNMGKHATDLNLKNENDRKIFESLLEDADVIIDGYRTNAIEKLGYGPSEIQNLAKKRGKGYIYASENCFGFEGAWSERPGWQQIADCATGVAWAQGTALGLNEPMVPPFPMSDYGTGCIVATAVLIAIHKRATKGGSYWCKSSLVQYDLLLLKQGKYPSTLWREILAEQDDDVFKLRYYDSVDKISSTALKSLKKSCPKIFEELEEYYTKAYSDGFNGELCVLKPVVEYEKTQVGYSCPSRPNGFDRPEWW
ncbi:uncharacterized protein PRCAT00004266001 [Priceomyces carsonii]|uniref:uncharacterized protein n=1 Tax=Priceomyces carsonii TaxID=28549 RepID=UPI002ED980AF|nr:unnamed protein product [Priceomyces carsonii]